MANFTYASSSNATVGTLPAVRVEVRHGKSASSQTEMTRDEFLIGAAAGCELRLPGTNLPPVVCIISRQSDGVRLRKVAQNTPVLLNGQPVSNSNLAPLNQGDTVTIGRTDIHFSIERDAEQVASWETELERVEISPEIERLLESPTASVSPAVPTPVAPNWDEREREFRHRYDELIRRERNLQDSHKELDNDRILWYRRREEMEKEHQRSRAELAGDIQKRGEIEERYSAFEKRHLELSEWRTKLNAQQTDLERLNLELSQKQHDFQEREKQLSQDWEERRAILEAEYARKRTEADDAHNMRSQVLLSEHENRQSAFESDQARQREELEAELKALREKGELEWRIWIEQKDTGYTQFREQLEAEFFEKYRKRGEELDRFQLTVREAAVQLREQRNMHEDQVRQFEPRWAELLKHEDEIQMRVKSIEDRYEEWQKAQAESEARQAEWRESVKRRDDDLYDWESRLKNRESAIERNANEVDQLKAKFQLNLVRLGELQLELDGKDKHLTSRAAEVDSHWDRIRLDSSTFEEQARELDERRGNLALEEQSHKQKLREIEDREAGLHQRLSQVETQQAMLANLRVKVEQEREEMQREASRIAEERQKQDAYLKEAREKLREAELLRHSLADQTLSVAEGQKVHDERAEMMRQAMMQLRGLQDQLSDQDSNVRRREEDLARKQAEVADEAAVWKARMDQLTDLQRKVEEDRAALKLRESDLALADEPRRVLQEQIRKRSDELAARQSELNEKAKQLDDQTRMLQQQADALEALRADAIAARKITEVNFAALANKDEQLRKAGEQLRISEEALSTKDRELAEAKAILAQDRRMTTDQTDAATHKLGLFHAEIKDHAEDLRNQIPEFESRLQLSLDKTAQVRDQLRGQLSELHTYARQSQEELQAIRDQLSSEVSRLQQQEATLNRSRTEHRHSVASFKQQLLEWQSRFSDLKQVMAANQTQSAQKQAFIEVTTLELVHKTEELEKERKIVTGQRGEVERHLNDMREWYRQKLREIVDGSRSTRNDDYDDHSILPLMTKESAKPVRVEDLDSGDRKLGEMLRTYDLVDAETLNALWNAAKASHKPLRQVLLASSALTVYQMALIEAGNINGLVLGRFRVIDRLPGTSREAQFKVYDPQGLADSRRVGPQGPEGICLLRHLSESEMHDAVRPDEYRERYRVARDLAHPNIRSTYEVLDIAGRPAVLQEWQVGLPGDEWPALAAAPGVWFRLISQAGLALYTAAQVGLHHGRIRPESFWLSREGLVKVDGFGEPNWIAGTTTEPSAAGDLLALGKVAIEWADLNKRRKKFPDPLQQVLRRLGADDNTRDLYASPTDLLDDLDKAGASVPINGDIWDKLLQAIEENDRKESLRQSA